MAVDHQIYDRKENYLSITKRIKEEDENVHCLLSSLSSSGLICSNEILFDLNNLLKSLNEQVNSVQSFIDCLIKDKDHIIRRHHHHHRYRSYFHLFFYGSKQSFQNVKSFYPKDESILNEIQWKKLLHMNVRSCHDQWYLLYRGSRDGFHCKDFHRLCDQQGPTIIVIRTFQGRLFGGYTSISWNSTKSQFENDPYAFLFSFSLNSSIKYSLIDRHSQYSIWNSPNYGPTFGRGADLFICSDSHLIGQSYSKLPSSYRDSTGLKHLALAGQQQFFIEQIEIYS